MLILTQTQINAYKNSSTPRLIYFSILNFDIQTKLTRTNNDDANLQISGYISDYSVSTTAIAANQATGNRLNVGVHLIVKNNVENKTDEYDVSRNFDFSADLSLQQAEVKLQDQILSNITD